MTTKPKSIADQQYAARWDAIFATDLELDTKEQALDEMARLNQEHGLYEPTPNPMIQPAVK